jgi:hypothetical protein
LSSLHVAEAEAGKEGRTEGTHIITLVNGNIQDAAGNSIIPNGSLELYLSSDAQVIAPPNGQVLGGTRNFVRFYFDSSGVLIQVPPVKIWSNLELAPSTHYIANMYDENQTRLNNEPMQWVFNQAAGSTVDISAMINAASSQLPNGTYIVTWTDVNGVLVGTITV